MKTEIAVIGMGGIFPDALDLSEYWSNILSAKDCIIDIPETYWDLSDFYDPDPSAEDKTYAHKAALCDYVAFDSMEFGIPPKVMESIAVDQLFALIVAKQALLDANMFGPDAKPFNREKAGVILSACIGKTSYSLSQRLQVKKIELIMRNSHVPEPLIQRVCERWKNSEFEWNEESEPGFLSNVTAGRIANRLDLYGTNCTVDAACASSFASLKYAVNELQNKDCDVVLTGGVNLDTTPFSFVSFSKTPALSRSNKSRPFDSEADGMMLGDGVAMMVLKRLEDAERDNDRIYGVIESIGSSSDGRAKSIFAPRKEGQMLALERAYKEADIDPKTVGMIEAHGTGTVVGDENELGALSDYMQDYNCDNQSIMIGSIKSQIGHTRLTAGVAGLIKATMAVYHGVLPPTINVKKSNKRMKDSPFYITGRPKPWLVNAQSTVRRAGISAFGFGGTNFHVVLREYINNEEEHPYQRMYHSPVGLYLHGENRDSLVKQIQEGIEQLAAGDVEYFNTLFKAGNENIPQNHVRLGFVAGNIQQAKAKMETALELLESETADSWEKKGVFYRKEAVGSNAKIATLFSGQGSQHVNMAIDATVGYPEMRSMFETVDNALIEMDREPISSVVYPNTLPEEDMQEYEKALTDTRNTQPALAAVSGGLYRVLKKRGYTEDCFIGHSYGEITALWAAGALDDKAFAALSAARGEILAENTEDGASMLAVFKDKQTVEKLVEGFDRLYVSNENSGKQTIVSGDNAQLEQLEKKLASENISSKRLKVSLPYHSPYMEQAGEEFQKVLKKTKFSPLKGKIYANATAGLYPKTGEAAKKVLAKQIVSPVLFKSSIEKAYEDGARIFVEVGPGNTLASLTGQILEGREYYAIATNPNKLENSQELLERLMVQLRVLGVFIGQDPYFRPLQERLDKTKTKSSFMLPPLHFVLEETAERIDEAVNGVDPYPEETDPAQTQEIQNDIQSNYSDGRKDSPDDMGNVKTDVQTVQVQQPAEPVNTNTTQIQKKEQTPVPAAGNPAVQSGISAFQDAYNLQSLNGEVFKQFMQSQGHQLNVFNEMYQTAGSNTDGSTNGLLHFMEAFQSNSMQAYNTYFTEQKSFLTGAPSETAAIETPPAAAPVITPPAATVEAQVATPEAPVQQEVPEESPETTTDIVPTIEFENSVEGEEGDVKKFGSDVTQEEMEKRLLEIISDCTGYPEEMIDTEMNIESDLGIDSIKRVEIFSKLNEELEDGFTQDEIEILATLYTITDIAEYLATRDGSTGEKITAESISSMMEEMGIDEDTDLETITAKLAEKELEKEQEEASDAPVVSSPVNKTEEIEVSSAEMTEVKENDTFTSAVEKEAAEQEKAADTKEAPEEDDPEIKRYSFFRKEIDAPSDKAPIVTKDGLVAITRDTEGLSVEIGKELKKKGYQVAYIGFPGHKKDTVKTHQMRNYSGNSVENALKTLKEDAQNKPLVGFIHVGSPNKRSKDIYQVFNRKETEILKSVFMFARYFEEYATKPEKGENFFAAVARMDGQLGTTSQWTGASVQGGVFAMVKSLQREWPDTYCKAVDIPFDSNNVFAASMFMEELFDSVEEYELSEVARDKDGKRYVMDIRVSDEEKPAKELPGRNDVFVVTGGGRGVTSACTLKVASEYKSKFILLGRSAIDQDLSWAKGETDPDKMKAIILADMKETGNLLKPKEIDQKIKDAQRQMEIESSLKAIKDAGGQVVYKTCDITDEQSVQEAVAQGSKLFGPVTGIIHGAGVLADKAISRKTEKDFDDVVGTKLAGLEDCLKAVKPEKLKYLLMFSSTAAHFGNQKQVDYAIANDILNKIAFDFKKLYPNALSLAVNWGAWKGGMITDALQLFLKTKGEVMIPLEVGAEFFADQFRYDLELDSSQVMIAGTYKYINHDIDFMKLM